MKAKYLVRARRVSQTLFLLLFLFLLVESRLPHDAYTEYLPELSPYLDLRLDPPVTFFFQLDPLVFLSSLLSGHNFIKGFYWALGLVLITFFLGRIFCGFICPFGTLHHLMGTVKPALRGERMVQANRRRPYQKGKYFVLITVLVGAVIGLNFSGLMDPTALLFRSIALAVLPGIGAGIRSLFDAMAGSEIKIINLASPIWAKQKKSTEISRIIEAKEYDINVNQILMEETHSFTL